MSKVLITGDKGFIGSHLVKKFKKYEGFDVIEGKDILHSKLPKADVVIHLAAQTSVINSTLNPIGDAITNILGTIRLAEHYSDKRFIFASSGGAIQEKIESPYGLSKYCAEEYIKLFCKDYVILRFPNIYGEGSKSVVDKFIKNPITIYGDGTATRDYLHVSDLISAIHKSLKWKSGTYSLGTGKSTTVQAIAEATGKPIKKIKAIKGELQHSKVKNTAPDWKARIDVIDYIRSYP